MTRAEQAREYFKQGYACSQAVALAFADVAGVDEATIAKTMLPFGGGLGRLRLTCGAVSGMIMVLSNKFASTDPNDHEKKKALYALIQKAAGDFREENGSIICRELLGLSEGVSSPVPEKRTDTYYKKRPCAELVHCAAAIAEKYLEENN